MGGVDTRNRYHVHWGPPSSTPSGARSRRCGAPAGRCLTWLLGVGADRLGAARRDLDRGGLRPAAAAAHPRADAGAYGHLPVAALQHISHATGAWYSEIYGIATQLPAPALRAAGRPVDRRLPLSDLPAPGRRADPARRSRSALGTEVGGVSPEGAVRLVATDCDGDERRRATGRRRRQAAAAA